MKPVIIGCRTADFPGDWVKVIAEHKPFGMIVFAEPAEQGKEAVKHVVKQFRDAVGWEAPVFIDMEGGLVTRLKNSFNHGWAVIPGHRVIGDVYLKDQDAGKELSYLVAQLIADEMIELGINVNCAPVVDRVFGENIDQEQYHGKGHATSSSFYKRSFGSDNDMIVALAQEYINGLESRGVYPVVKHVPGYGRVDEDPHYSLPVIDASHEELSATDFEIFKHFNKTKSMMTAHLIYKAIDDQYSATISSKVIKDIIRREIGFKGLLIPDSIEMVGIAPELFDTEKKQMYGLPWPKPGALAQITRWCFDAGCDVVMHSDLSRDLSHTVEILEASEMLSSGKESQMRDIFTLADYQQLPAFDRENCVTRINEILEKYKD